LFAGSQYYLPSSGTDKLTVKPVDPHQDPFCSAPTWCLELTSGSTFAPGDDWGDLDLSLLRFQFGRNYPQGTNKEKVGQTYQITAYGVNSQNYDIRYMPGTMKVVAP